jgi:hypothetical protein
MVVTDTIYHYQLFEHFDVHCRLRIYQHNEQHIVMITELHGNKDMAITNTWPELVTGIVEYYKLDMAHTQWIEHYPQGEYAQQGARGDTFDLITLENDVTHWRRMTIEEVEQLAGEKIV